MQKLVLDKVFSTEKFFNREVTTKCFLKEKVFVLMWHICQQIHIPTLQYKTDQQQRHVAFKLLTTTSITKQTAD